MHTDINKSLFFLSPANGNRYEGMWERGKKSGEGRFIHLDKGQLFSGTWVDDIARCGEMEDVGRDTATNPSPYPIPQVGHHTHIES